jgi:SAM-dependent methyltransferase
MLRKKLVAMYNAAIRLNARNITRLLEPNPGATLVDLGCDTGDMTMALANAVGTHDIHGVEVVKERLQQARDRGIVEHEFDLNGPYDLPSESFDVVHANQVIEHLTHSDNFLAEIYRILRPDGYAIISTENASSWCNIAASILGYQIFSLTNFSSRKLAVGNPLNLHNPDGSRYTSWHHVRVYNILGLKDYLRVFGLRPEAVRGAGYFPLPAILGAVDVVHCHFMTFKARKPSSDANEQ